MRYRRCRLGFMVACLVGLNVWGAPPAVLGGTLTDALGDPVPQGEVLLEDSNGAVLGHAPSDAQGHFQFPAPPPGIYALVGHRSGYDDGTAIMDWKESTVSPAEVVLTRREPLAVTLSSARTTPQRNGVSSSTGGSVTQFDQKAIADLPQGDNTPLNDILLQAPGVVNDSYGQLHVRGEHANLQYRVNGLMLPDTLSGFGQTLDAHFARQIDLLTGALPAEYGDRTSGVVEINSKNQFNGQGQVDLYGGTQGTFNPSVSYGNSVGNLSYFFSGSYLTNDIGIERPTASNAPLHDATQQVRGFGYLSYLIDPETKFSLMLGTYAGHFQIPVIPGQTPDPNHLGILGQMGLNGYNSATVNDQQYETNRFMMAALQGSLNDRTDYQTAIFTQSSELRFTPDTTGNLVYNGAASQLMRSSVAAGVQTDITFRLDTDHTLRYGLYGTLENVVNNNSSTVFPVSPTTGLVTGNPYSIVDNQSKNGNTLLGLYLQDSWKINEPLTLDYGLRYDQIQAYVNQSQWSPRLNLVYRFDPATTIHGGFARYFTPPPTELVGSGTLTLFQNTTMAAPGLDSPVSSESANYYDLGLTHQWGSRLDAGIDAFYKQATQTLDEGQFGPSLIMTPFNYAQGVIEGIELTANYHGDQGSAYANLARTRSVATQLDSSQFLFSPAVLAYAANNWIYVDHQQSLTASLGGALNLDSRGMTRLNGDVTYQSGLRSGFANTQSLPSYTVVNLGLTHHLDLASTGPLDLRLTIINLFNTNYLIHDGTGIGVFAPQYGMPRGVFAGVTIPLGPAEPQKDH